MLYHAPERFHDVNPSFASYRAYMCLFMDLYLGFNPWDAGCSHVSMITKMVGILGHPGRATTAYGTCDDSWYDQRKKLDRKVILVQSQEKTT